MTPYERGHLDGQIAMRERAAAECYAESVRWRNEAGEHQPAQALCAVRILSLQPEGADQRGTGEDSRAEQSCENRAPHHNPGEQVSSVENPDSLSVGARPARPGPDVVVPVEPTDTPINPVVQEAIDNFGRYYAERHKLGMSIRSDMQYIARLASRWAEK